MTNDSLPPVFERIMQRLQSMTPEEKQRLEDQRTEAAKQDHYRKIANLRSDMNAPSRHLKCQPSLDGEWGKKLTYLTNCLGTGFTIALVGTRGTGKTQMAVQLMLAATKKLSSARFCTAAEFFMEIKAAYRRDSELTEQCVLERYRKPRLLVIDEVGKRSESEWETTLLFELLNKRYGDMTDTLIIDNRTQAEFQAAIGPSLASRISESGGIIDFNWPTFRQ